MESALTEEPPVLKAGTVAASPQPIAVGEGSGAGNVAIAETLPSETPSPELLADLHDPELVLSPDYIGTDRRAGGLAARVRRATFEQRRSVLRLEVMVLALVAVVVVTSIVLMGPSPTPVSARKAVSHRSPRTHSLAPVVAPAVSAPPTTTPVPVPTTPTTAAPTPAAASPAPAAAAAAPAPVTPPASTATLTPTQMGAQALALVRYPWQNIPGYTIQFLPISAAPSPGFYGNTTFTWGQAGGTSVLYVYPGETVERLAGITAFEIGHEVDAAAVEPQGGETQIENILGIHPQYWAPHCDCAEQGYLSGWYSAAFSNYWSPGVGNWSQIAPEPTGATLAAVQPWLNPTIS